MQGVVAPHGTRSATWCPRLWCSHAAGCTAGHSGIFTQQGPYRLLSAHLLAHAGTHCGEGPFATEQQGMAWLQLCTWGAAGQGSRAEV